MSEAFDNSKPGGKRVFRSAAIRSAFHPIVYARVLIQVGHEPLPPKLVTTIFGNKVLRLPNVFEYLQHIKKIDGWIGLYRGLGPRLVESAVNASARSLLEKNFVAENIRNQDHTISKLLREIYKESILIFGCSYFSHPFHVISVRMMVQFIGKETKYNTIFSSIKEIYHEEGILGFFSGFVPLLIGQLATMMLAKSISYYLSKYVYPEDTAIYYTKDTFTHKISMFFAGEMFYRFKLVGNIMAISDTNLEAPLLTSPYSSWTDCWVQLGKKGLQSRGSSLFRRNLLSI